MRWRGAIILAVPLLLVPAAPGAAYNAPGPRWPGHTIRYYNAMPSKFDWTVRQATSAWNRSGAAIRFREVGSRRAAQVVVAFGDTQGYAGYATIGRQPGAYAHLAPSQKNGGAGVQPVLARLLAHELGHVIGLDHVGSKGCPVMQPVPGSGCKQPESGYYNCRWLARDDVRGAIRLYGGKVRKPHKQFCLLEPRPPDLRDVRFSGGTSTQSPLEITWSVPTGVRKGSTVAVDIYEPGRCNGDSRSGLLDSYTADVTARRWIDDSRTAGQPGSFCYEVTLANQYGLRSSPVRSLVQRTQPPVAAPVITELLEYPDGYSDYLVRASVEQDADLWVVSAASGACVTVYDPDQYPLGYSSGVGEWTLFGVPVGRSCLSFFAVASDGRASPVVTREIDHAPRPEL